MLINAIFVCCWILIGKSTVSVVMAVAYWVITIPGQHLIVYPTIVKTVLGFVDRIAWTKL